jgi:hypothetical protein
LEASPSGGNRFAALLLPYPSTRGSVRTSLGRSGQSLVPLVCTEAWFASTYCTRPPALGKTDVWESVRKVHASGCIALLAASGKTSSRLLAVGNTVVLRGARHKTLALDSQHSSAQIRLFIAQLVVKAVALNSSEFWGAHDKAEVMRSPTPRSLLSARPSSPMTAAADRISARISARWQSSGASNESGASDDATIALATGVDTSATGELTLAITNLGIISLSDSLPEQLRDTEPHQQRSWRSQMLRSQMFGEAMAEQPSPLRVPPRGGGSDISRLGSSGPLFAPKRWLSSPGARRREPVHPEGADGGEAQRAETTQRSHRHSFPAQLLRRSAAMQSAAKRKPNGVRVVKVGGETPPSSFYLEVAADDLKRMRMSKLAAMDEQDDQQRVDEILRAASRQSPQMDNSIHGGRFARFSNNARTTGASISRVSAGLGFGALFGMPSADAGPAAERTPGSPNGRASRFWTSAGSSDPQGQQSVSHSASPRRGARGSDKADRIDGARSFSLPRCGKRSSARKAGATSQQESTGDDSSRFTSPKSPVKASRLLQPRAETLSVEIGAKNAL